MLFDMIWLRSRSGRPESGFVWQKALLTNPAFEHMAWHWATAQQMVTATAGHPSKDFAWIVLDSFEPNQNKLNVWQQPNIFAVYQTIPKNPRPQKHIGPWGPGPWRAQGFLGIYEMYGTYGASRAEVKTAVSWTIQKTATQGTLRDQLSLQIK